MQFKAFEQRTLSDDNPPIETYTHTYTRKGYYLINFVMQMYADFKLFFLINILNYLSLYKSGKDLHEKKIASPIHGSFIVDSAVAW